MKKYILLIAALAVVEGCVNKEIPSQVGDDAARPADVSRSLTFTADVLTKTALADDWTVSWCEGDRVKILWKGGNSVSEARLEGGKAFFSAVVDEVEDYYAVYPASVSASVLPDGSLSFDVPASQSGKFADCAVIVAHTTLESLDFGRFKSAVGMIRFMVDDTSLTRARFSSGDGSAVAGSVSTDASLGSFTASATSASIDIDLDGSGTYYMAVPPGLTFRGLKFSLGNDSVWKGDAASETQATVAAGQILCVNAKLDEKIEVVGDIYISDSESLISLLEDSGAGDKLNGHTVHIAEGTYNLGDGGLALSYETSPVTLTLEGERGKTIITASGSTGILSVTSQGVNLNLKGLTFSSGKHGVYGGALTLTAGKHTIEDCIFDKNECTSTSADKTGGAIYVGGNATLDISSSTFTDNVTSVTGGGAIAIFTTSRVTVLGSRFTGNRSHTGSAYTGNGGAILQKKAGNITYVAGCSFSGNGTNTNGPDIFSSAGEGILLYNDTFAHPLYPDPKSRNRGLVRLNAKTFVANCTFVMEVDPDEAGAGCNNGLLAFGQNNDNVIVNNLLLSNAGYSLGTGAAYDGTTTRSASSYGHNVYNTAPKVNITDKGNGTDLTGMTAAMVAGDTSLSAAGLLEWDGPAVKLPSFSAITETEMESVIGSYPAVGADFLAWLKEKGVFNKDAAGTSRGDSWWPGAYQGAE